MYRICMVLVILFSVQFGVWAGTLTEAVKETSLAEMQIINNQIYSSPTFLGIAQAIESKADGLGEFIFWPTYDKREDHPLNNFGKKSMTDNDGDKTVIYPVWVYRHSMDFFYVIAVVKFEKSDLMILPLFIRFTEKGEEVFDAAGVDDQIDSRAGFLPKLTIDRAWMIMLAENLNRMFADRQNNSFKTPEEDKQEYIKLMTEPGRSVDFKKVNNTDYLFDWCRIGAGLSREIYCKYFFEEIKKVKDIPVEGRRLDSLSKIEIKKIVTIQPRHYKIYMNLEVTKITGLLFPYISRFSGKEIGRDTEFIADILANAQRVELIAEIEIVMHDDQLKMVNYESKESGRERIKLEEGAVSILSGQLNSIFELE